MTLRAGKHAGLLTVLLIANGYLAWGWIADASGANDVGRQWIRITMPAMMLISSATIAIIYYAVCGVVGWIRKRPEPPL